MDHKQKLREASERISEIAKEIAKLRQTIDRLLREAEDRRNPKPSSDGFNTNPNQRSSLSQ